MIIMFTVLGFFLGVAATSIFMIWVDYIDRRSYNNEPPD